MRVVLASNNTGKIREFSALFAPLNIELIPQNRLGIEDADETGFTFIENALIKARHAAKISGLPALADDSGLVIPALNGAPGIFSARYAGQHGDHVSNIAKVLHELQHVQSAQRQAEFRCVLTFMVHEKDPSPLVCEGRWVGSIIHEHRGNQGFGYDPIFYVPEENKTAAELSADVKNRISHRGKALQTLLKLLPDKLNECALR